MLAHLVVDLLVAQINLGAQAGLFQRGERFLGIGVGVRDDGAHLGLHRRQPQRQVPGGVLQQDAGEALHRAEHRPVDHHRRLLVAVGVDVEGAEALRQIEIDLGGAALPVAADGIAQHVLELRAVEGALARVDAGLDLAA